MSSDPVILAQEWRWLRGVLRAIIALSCFYSVLFSWSRVSTPVAVLTCVFAVYATTALLWSGLDRIQSALAALFAEAAFFALFAGYGADSSAWIGSLFFLYLMLAAAVDHSWGEVLVIFVPCFGFFAIVRPLETGGLLRVMAVAGVLAGLLAFQKRKLQQQLLESVRREEELHGQMEQIRDAERQRIAGDFHDGPLQTFIAMQVRLDILGTLMKRDPGAGMEDLKELQELSRTIVSDVRSFLRGMRPAETDASDLVASTRRIIEYFQKDTGIAGRFVCSETSIKVVPESSHELLQILREALHNVQKHSRASRVVVSLGQNGKAVELAVDDDGEGFAFSGSFNLDELDLLRLGPASIKRRVRSLGGDLSIESRPGHGAGLKIRVPN